MTFLPSPQNSAAILNDVATYSGLLSAWVLGAVAYQAGQLQDSANLIDAMLSDDPLLRRRGKQAAQNFSGRLAKKGPLFRRLTILGLALLGVSLATFTAGVVVEQFAPQARSGQRAIGLELKTPTRPRSTRPMLPGLTMARAMRTGPALPRPKGDGPNVARI